MPPAASALVALVELKLEAPACHQTIRLRLQRRGETGRSLSGDRRDPNHCVELTSGLQPSNERVAERPRELLDPHRVQQILCWIGDSEPAAACERVLNDDARNEERGTRVVGRGLGEFRLGRSREEPVPALSFERLRTSRSTRRCRTGEQDGESRSSRIGTCRQPVRDLDVRGLVAIANDDERASSLSYGVGSGRHTDASSGESRRRRLTGLRCRSPGGPRVTPPLSAASSRLSTCRRRRAAPPFRLPGSQPDGSVSYQRIDDPTDPVALGGSV